jgi:hypothetical protein
VFGSWDRGFTATHIFAIGRVHMECNFTAPSVAIVGENRGNGAGTGCAYRAAFPELRTLGQNEMWANSLGRLRSSWYSHSECGENHRGHNPNGPIATGFGCIRAGTIARARPNASSRFGPVEA